ncbi:MAG: type III pantothenate kinase [Rikenellaceae bacterium]
MNLIVDIGNTMVKMAIMDGGELVEQVRSSDFDDRLMGELCKKFNPRGGIICSTRGDVRDIVARMEHLLPLLILDGRTPLPIKINYKTPQTLGRDRVAAAVGAQELYPGRNILIVDFGTAITADIVSCDDGFMGGTISPGVMSRFRSLHDYTASLPLCAPTYQELELAQSTEEAIVQGVMNSVAFEIEGYIERYMLKFDELLVIFSGGDAIFFEKRIKNAIFANREILFVGLNRILEYNAE